MIKGLLGSLLLTLSLNAFAAAPQPGERAPNEAGFLLDDTRVDLASMQGKVVVMSFWASWCKYCMKEMPILEGIQLNGKDSIQVIAVNTEDYKVFKKLATHLSKLSMKISHDYQGKGSAAYAVDGLPHMVIIGRDGRIKEIHRGYGESSLDKIVASINQALAD